METTMNTETAIEAPAETIEYGGVIWRLDAARNQECAYSALSKNGEEMAISRYKDNSPNAYRWHWRADFYKTFDGLRFNTQHKALSGIVNDRDAAMTACLNAKEYFCMDISLMMNVLFPDSQVAQSFRAGQEDIKQKIAEVIL